jgi:hypothetical protein
LRHSILGRCRVSTHDRSGHKSGKRRLFPAKAEHRNVRFLAWSRLAERIAIGSLTAPADPRETAHLRSRPAPKRRFSRVSLARADDPLRRAGIGRRREPCAWRRRIDRAVGGYRRRRVGAERRDISGVADAAGIGERSRIGRAERHARYRRIAGAGRAGWRRQLRECPAGGDQGERREENKRRIAEHRGLSRGRPCNDHVARAFPCFQFVCFEPPVFSAVRPAPE